jgi:ligand-binding sensor domain-containing protein/signal transduction histidine kinase/DNA-binding response OmpR family regulator
MKKHTFICCSILAALIAFLSPVDCKAQISRLYTSSNSGLPNSQINQIYQDKKGFVWIATEDGLSCFDGMKFSSFLHDANNKNSIKSNYVQTIFEDDCNNFWIGTVSGLQRFDRTTNRFEDYPLYDATSHELLKPHITAIINNDRDNIVVCTAGHSFYRINKHTLKITQDENVSGILLCSFIRAAFQDSHNNLWLGTETQGCILFRLRNGQYNYAAQWCKSRYITTVIEDKPTGKVLMGSLNRGMYVYDPATGNVREALTADARNCAVKSMLRDSKGRIWVGTNDRGLLLFNPKSESFEPIPSENNDKSNASWHVSALMEDNQGNVWAGLYQKGIYFIPDYINKFEYYGFANQGGTENNSCVLSILIDRDGGMWVGTDGSGLFYRAKGQKTPVCFNKTNSALTDNSITSVYQDKKGTIWIGTMFNGLFVSNGGRSISRYPKQAEIASNKTMSICGDAAGNVWIGTYDGGLNRIDAATGSISRYVNQTGNNSAGQLSNNWINTMTTDRAGNLLVGTLKGLNEIDPSGRIRYYNNTRGLPENIKIYALCEDSNHILWIGSNSGLLSFDRKNGRTELITMAGGLPNNFINAIVEDKNKNLWISTNHGLAKYSLATRTFTKFYSYDGLQSNEFWRNAFCKAADGKLYFGGINGVTAFNPSDISRSRKVPDVYITDFYIFNKSVNVGQESARTVQLDKSVAYAKEIRIRQNDNVFSLEFVALEFTHPQSITYRYIMEGFDKDWKEVSADNRLVTYTNLPHGTYIFKVQSCSSDLQGSHSETQLRVIILPPWWQTWWAYFIYCVILSMIGYRIYLQLKQKMDNRRKQLEREHTEQIKEAKLRFFTNISHEIRTPITLIMSPLEKLRMEEKDSQKKDIYNLMYRNSARILRLINQLMDMRKIDNQQMKLRFQETDMVFLVKDIMMSFDYLAKNKHIDFRLAETPEHLTVWVDQGNFDKILFNVLSNAFKFTPDGGTICVQLRVGEDSATASALKNYFEIKIQDSGPGIRKEAIDKIYDRFFQAAGQTDNPGSGIGLHLTKQLVDLHHGTIMARNEEVGCSFIIRIPLFADHLTEDELQESRQPDLYPQPAKKAFDDESLALLESNDGDQEACKKMKKKPTVVAVDDDKDLLSYLRFELSGQFNIETFDNCRGAWNAITRILPDVVVSDIVMPEMDGNELCRKIKSNPNTIDIPVILLSSKTKDDDIIEGLDSGADLYLTKPFNIDILKRNVLQLVGSRQTIRKKYTQPIDYDYEHLKMNSADKRLLEKTIAVIKKNIEDSEFNVERLSEEVGLSRVHLNRKLKELINTSPSEMIRSIRLKQAAFLLINNEVNISEVAYKVGFSSHSYFTISFHDFFGMKPSEFIDKYKHDPDNPILKDIIG